MTNRMYNPPHPGEVLKGLYLDEANINVTDFAERLGVDRKTISRLINGRCGVTAEMALRLGKALGTAPDVWFGMQHDYDLWHAAKAHKKALKAVKRIAHVREDRVPA